MKKLLIALLLLVAANGAMAQEDVKTKKSNGFRWSLEYQSAWNKGCFIGAGASVGYRFNENFYLGVASDALFDFGWGEPIVPVYVDGLFAFKKEPSTPVMNFRVGMEVTEPLFVGSAAFGYRIAFNKFSITPLMGFMGTDDSYALFTAGVSFEL